MIELHAEAPKIIVPLFARTLPELTAQAAAAQRADAADLVELRLDPQAAALIPGTPAGPAGLADGFGPGARCHNETAHRDHPHSAGGR